MTVHTWSQTRNANTTADSTIDWREANDAGTTPGSFRDTMAAFAKFRDDQSGKLLTGGTSSAYTVTTNQGFTSLANGLVVCAKVHTATADSPTLAVDGLAAKPIVKVCGTDIKPGELRTGSIQTFVYYNGEWIAHNARSYLESGARSIFKQTNAPTGWTKSTVSNDGMIRVVTGGTGGDLGGATYWSSILTERFLTTAEMPSHDHASQFTLTAAPDHTHTATWYSGEINNRENWGGAAQHDNVWRNSSTQTSGSSGAHAHAFSGTSGSYGNGLGIDFDVQYVDFIIAEKD